LYQRCLALRGPLHAETLYAQRGLMNATGCTRTLTEACPIGLFLVDGWMRAHRRTLDAMSDYAWWLWPAGRGPDDRRVGPADRAEVWPSAAPRVRIRQVVAADVDAPGGVIAYPPVWFSLVNRVKAANPSSVPGQCARTASSPA